MIARKCKLCHETKPINEYAEYYVKDSKTDKKYYHRRLECKTCTSAKSLASLRKTTYEHIVEMRKINKCEICKTHLEEKSRYIDHCHKTGIIRGVLCPRCNSVLAFFEKKQHLFESVKRYINKYRIK